MNCKICQHETSYSNGLCGPCYNHGLRNYTSEGVVVDVRALLHYMSKSMDQAYVDYYQKIFDALPPRSPELELWQDRAQQAEAILFSTLAELQAVRASYSANAAIPNLSDDEKE